MTNFKPYQCIFVFLLWRKTWYQKQNSLSMTQQVPNWSLAQFGAINHSNTISATTVSIDWCLYVSFSNLDKNNWAPQVGNMIIILHVCVFPCIIFISGIYQSTWSHKEGSDGFNCLQVIRYCWFPDFSPILQFHHHLLNHMSNFSSHHVVGYTSYRAIFNLILNHTILGNRRRQGQLSGKKCQKSSNYLHHHIKPFKLTQLWPDDKGLWSVRNCWEAKNEKYIHNIKHEIIIMRHHKAFLSMIPCPWFQT